MAANKNTGSTPSEERVVAETTPLLDPSVEDDPSKTTSTDPINGHVAKSPPSPDPSSPHTDHATDGEKPFPRYQILVLCYASMVEPVLHHLPLHRRNPRLTFYLSGRLLHHLPLHQRNGRTRRPSTTGERRLLDGYDRVSVLACPNASHHLLRPHRRPHWSKASSRLLVGWYCGRVGALWYERDAMADDCLQMSCGPVCGMLGDYTCHDQ
jgi:hypothetical protein